MQWARRQTGFTIVELLIVIVVIAILAAITIISYNGITQRSRDAVAQNAVQSATKKLETYSIQNGGYPVDIAALGLSQAAGTAIQYSTSGNGYCVTVTNGGVAYYSGANFTYTGSSSGTVNQAKPTSGACPGHGTSGASITNLSRNPGVEVNATGFSGPNSSTAVRDTSRFRSGAASLLVTMPINSSSTSVGAAVFNYSDVTSVLETNTTYTVSLWVYVPTGTVSPTISLQGSGRTASVNPAERSSNVKNQWVQLHNTFTTLASGNVVVYVLNNAATTVAGTQFWIDDIMIVKGDTSANYADGSSNGWVWNGTAGNATSSGPAL